MSVGRSAAAALEALDEQILRTHIVFAAAGKTNLTAAEMVDLLCSTFPEDYPRENRDDLTARVARITPPPRRTEEPTPSPSPATNKRRRTDELGHGGGDLRDASRNNHNRPMFRDLLGMDSVIEKLKSEVMVPLHQRRPEILRHLGVEPTARILLHGLPGCGKARLARAIANEARLPLFEISAARLVSRVSAEENIRDLFSTAYMRAPSVVFIDKLDAMMKETEPRILNELMACMDEPCGVIDHYDGSESCNSRPGYVLVIGATDSTDALDPALRQRFDREFALRVPGYYRRFDILSALTSNLKVEVGIDLKKIALCTLGYVAGDLVALAKKAGIIAANRYMRKRMLEFDTNDRVGVELEGCSNELEHLSITMADFVEAAMTVRPSSRLDGFSTTPNAKWDDVGGLQSLKLELDRHIFKRIKFPDVYKDLGVDLTTSFFLYGPSGCGKTLIVKALANEAGANFLHIKGPKLLSYSGQCELVMHIIFNYARDHPPCIVFFDQLEAIITGDGEGQSSDFEKLIFSQLEELNDTEQSGVYVIGATNRLDVVHHLASSYGENGYFAKDLHVPLPTPEERGEILKVLARNKPIDADVVHVDLMALGKDIACERFNGSDLSDLMKRAAEAAIDRPALSCGDQNIPWTIKEVDFKNAMSKISPSVLPTELRNWELEVNVRRVM